MTDISRSGCPINLSLEVLGDKWSLLIIRDMMFGNRRHFRELLTKSEEGISSNILADRLKTLLEEGIITREDDPTHKQKGIYSLTEQGIELLPVLAQMAAWGYKYLAVSEELGIRARLLSEGGPKAMGRVHGRVARKPSRREAAQASGPVRRRAAAGGLRKRRERKVVRIARPPCARSGRGCADVSLRFALFRRCYPAYYGEQR